MADIHLLDQATINRIAAGEVIDRPSSVVKELLENAMDAKATAVTIEIKDGGISFIRITDNGCGIEKSQIPLAFKRHATSKLYDISDLLNINSLGFRGEALSSIAAVAQVEMITKVSQNMLGVSYRIEDGIEKDVTDIGAPDGTTILVRNLFYHTPARKKFLKTPATEGNYINQLVENMALLRPDISIRFINSGQNKLYTNGNGRLKDLIYTIYGREIAANSLEIQYSCEYFSIHGYIGKPIISRGNRSFENYYINGRYVKSRLISSAIEQAYKSFMMQHRYPFTVLHIDIKPELIDVNVHPSKMEVRFQNEQEIFERLVNAIETTLKGRELIPDDSSDYKEEPKPAEDKKLKIPEPFEKRRLEAQREILPPKPLLTQTTGLHKRINVPDKKPEVISEPDKFDQPPVIREPEKTYKIPDIKDEPTLFSDKLLTPAARSKHKLIGQVFDTYWLIQYEDKLYIMDQHAAHEKVNYEHFIKAFNNKERITQFVSPPIIISLTMAEENILNQYKDIFNNAGFTIESYGAREYAISEVPADIYGINEKELFIEMLSELEEKSNLTPSELVAQKLASMSCKAAIKGNQHISFQEADALIDQLLTLDNPYNCPHGRPTLITITKYELEKKFKRIL